MPCGNKVFVIRYQKELGVMNGRRAHGFRKFYKSRAEQVMKPINVEITMGHNIGVSASYYKPTDHEVMEDYLKAVDSLTINSDKLIL